MKLELRKFLLRVNRKIPIDLLVFTPKEIGYLAIKKSLFIEKIMNTGEVLYEKAS